MDGARARAVDAAAWRQRLYVIIFRTDTAAGRAFDVTLLVLIVLSVVVVSLESVVSIKPDLRGVLQAVEWALTVAFTVEYTLRLACVRRPLLYATSFFGVVDLLSILPTYLSLIFAGAQSLMLIRVLRLLRVFRILKLVQLTREARVLIHALRASRSKISVFLVAVLTIAVITGTVVYLIEGDESGFTSIPRSMYWAIVTMTTVGYGDIAPRSAIGQLVAALLMIAGYSIIAVPTGIVSAELVRTPRPLAERSCGRCGIAGHEPTASYCRRCGDRLTTGASSAGG
ncbi:MAG: ion transporter [Nannocystaceae bacterium]